MDPESSSVASGGLLYDPSRIRCSSWASSVLPVGIRIWRRRGPRGGCAGVWGLAGGTSREYVLVTMGGARP
jgi:hypothetical protein